jgi:hypothetical protein
MRVPRRQFLHLAAGAAALPVVSRSARAQTYPSRPVRIIVGFTAGGPGDILARLIGQWLSERLVKPLLIENRPGAASNIGTEVDAPSHLDCRRAATFQEIVRNVRDIYHMRSQYIHHQISVSEEASIEKFFPTARAALDAALANVGRFATARDFH